MLVNHSITLQCRCLLLLYYNRHCVLMYVYLYMYSSCVIIMCNFMQQQKSREAEIELAMANGSVWQFLVVFVSIAVKMHHVPRKLNSFVLKIAQFSQLVSQSVDTLLNMYETNFKLKLAKHNQNKRHHRQQHQFHRSRSPTHVKREKLLEHVKQRAQEVKCSQHSDDCQVCMCMCNVSI